MNVKATFILIISESVTFLLTYSHVLEWASLLGFSAEGIYHLQLWTLLTSLFIHANIYHVAINMFLLYVFGSTLEKEKGPGWMLLSFFVGGIASLLVGIPFYPSNEIIIGSSIAVSSVMGTVLVLLPFRRSPFYLFYAPLGLVAIIYAIFNAFLAFYGQTALGISYPSHVIGFVIGAVLAPVVLQIKVFKSRLRSGQDAVAIDLESKS